MHVMLQGTASRDLGNTSRDLRVRVTITKATKLCTVTDSRAVGLAERDFAEGYEYKEADGGMERQYSPFTKPTLGNI